MVRMQKTFNFTPTLGERGRGGADSEMWPGSDLPS